MGAALLVAALLAGSQATTHKAQNKRAEAQDLVDQIAAGEGVVAAVSRLHLIGEEPWASAELTRQLSGSVDENQRFNIVLALSQMAQAPAEGALVGVLGDANGAIRMNAVSGLARMKSRAVKQIKPLLLDKTMGVRREAARALAASRDAKAGKWLIEAARAEGEPEARAAMLIGVGQVGDKSQARALEGFLDNSSESTRFAAAQALCLLGSPAGAAFAKKRLGSKDRYERLQGVALFEGAKAKEAAPVLKPLLKDPDKVVAAAAARILYQGGDGSSLDWLVVSSFRAQGEEKLIFEKELEPLRLADDQRKAILARAGIK